MMMRNARSRRHRPQLRREQDISGLCASVFLSYRLRHSEIEPIGSLACFVLASFSEPAAIKLAWGRTADDMSDEAWTLLDANLWRSQGGYGNKKTVQGDVSLSLSLLLKMTRLDDLGLGQLCFPEMSSEGEAGIR
jgi:hypothetical protein